MKNNFAIVIVVALVVGGLGFFAGMQYQKNNTELSGPGEQIQQRSDGQRSDGFPGGDNIGMRGETNSISGQIIEIDDKTMTVQTREEDNRIVIYSESTDISKSSEGSLVDLQIGEEIMIIGDEDTNGIVTAQTILIGGGNFRELED